MSDQHDRNRFGRIVESMRFDDLGPVRDSEVAAPHKARRALRLAARIGLYVVAVVLLVIGFVTINVVLLVVGVVVLIPAAVVHVISWLRRRRTYGEAT